MIFFKKVSLFILIILFLNGCNGKLPGADARKIPDGIGQQNIPKETGEPKPIYSQPKSKF